MKKCPRDQKQISIFFYQHPVRIVSCAVEALENLIYIYPAGVNKKLLAEWICIQENPLVALTPMNYSISILKAKLCYGFSFYVFLPSEITFIRGYQRFWQLFQACSMFECRFSLSCIFHTTINYFVFLDLMLSMPDTSETFSPNISAHPLSLYIYIFFFLFLIFFLVI